jgi:malate dehydrogenase (oxaloacetate-decarboxylating)
MNEGKKSIAMITNPRDIRGNLADALVDADIFIGLSAPGVITGEMIRTMAKNPLVFACANPEPEIDPTEAKEAGAAIVATGRSDYPNQINNVLAFPAIFRGTFDARASDINDTMKIAAATALAGMVSQEDLSVDRILPDALDPALKGTVAQAVYDAAIESGVARI